MSNEPTPDTTGTQDSGDQQPPAAPASVTLAGADYILRLDATAAPGPWVRTLDAAYAAGVAIRTAPILSEAECAALADGLWDQPTTYPVAALLRTIIHLREAADTAIRAMEQAAHERDEAAAEVTALLAQCNALIAQVVGTESRAATLRREVNRLKRMVEHAARETVRGRRYGP